MQDHMESEPQHLRKPGNASPHTNYANNQSKNFQQPKEPPKQADEIVYQFALQNFNVAGMSRIESFNLYWKPIGRKFGEWCIIYPILKEKQKLEANWEHWLLDKRQSKFRLKQEDDDEKLHMIKMVDNEESIFWYFWDYDTGTKKRMNGIAARQIEAGYQWIKDHNYEVDPVLRSGVEATEGIYAQLKNKHAHYKLSYAVQPAAQKDRMHICVYQINVRTGFQRLLERFPPETTAAKMRPGSFMEVFKLFHQESESEIAIDFWVKGGRTHFQQVWAPSVIRFTINAPVPDNRKAIEKELMKLWEEKKLVSVGQHANVELRQDARNVKHYLLSLADHKRLNAERDARSCKLAIMNYMHRLRVQKESVSTEMALSATRERFGQHFFTVFPTEQRFRKDFLQQYNETFVISYDHVPYDLDYLVEKSEKLFNRFMDVGEQSSEFCLNYIFEPQNKMIPARFAAVRCGIQTESDVQFPTDLFVGVDGETDTAFESKVMKHRNGVMSRTRSFQMKDLNNDVLIEDAVFDVAIDATRKTENCIVLSAFPFDRDHVYLFRSGSVARVDRQNCLKFLMKIAHLQPPKEVNGYEILSVETYADGSVQYGCRVKDETGEQGTELVRKRYHQIKNQGRCPEPDEKELELASPEAQLESRGQDSGSEPSMDKSVSSAGLSSLLSTLESVEEEVRRSAQVLSSFQAMGEITRRTDGHLLCEFLSYAVDERNEAFPTLAVFKDLESFTTRDEIRHLCSSNDYGDVTMSEVVASAIRCWNNKSVLGLANDGSRAHLFEIDVNHQADRIGTVTEMLSQLNLQPRAVMVKSEGQIHLLSDYIGGAGNGDGLPFSLKQANLGEILKVKFGECGILENFLQNEHLERIERIIGELHDWSHARKRVGRPGDFAVYFAQSASFDYLRDRLKRTKKGERNEDYDECMEHLKHFSINKWKQFTNKATRDHPRTVYVMVIDHAVYTLRKIPGPLPENCDVKEMIERVHKIDSTNSKNSFVYRDSDQMNVREACTARGFYVSLEMEPMQDFECHICYETKNSLSTLSCGHSACHQCIRQQLLRDNNNCALCRHDIMHPYMIPRPDQNTKNLVHKYYGPMFTQGLQYRSFEDDVEWHTIQAAQAEERGAAAGAVPA